MNSTISILYTILAVSSDVRRQKVRCTSGSLEDGCRKGAGIYRPKCELNNDDDDNVNSTITVIVPTYDQLPNFMRVEIVDHGVLRLLTFRDIKYVSFSRLLICKSKLC
jgi:hypothetical protein